MAEKNRAQWTLPLDEFRVFNPSLANYSEQLLISRCLTDLGYEWPVPWIDPEPAYPEDRNSVGGQLFNVSTAQRWGYHDAPAPDESALYQAEAWNEFRSFANSYAPDADFDASFEACSDGARHEDTIATVEADNYLGELAMQAADAALQEAEVQTTASKWRECLSEKVSFAVPASPWSESWPSEALMEQFGLAGQAKTASASAAEIEVAVADAECRESSGASAALYDALWDQQSDLIALNRDTLDRNRAQGVQQQKVVLMIIAENAPPAT